MRRAVLDDRTSSYYDSTIVATPSVASVIVNVVTVLYITAVTVIGLDTLLEALAVSGSNGFVTAFGALAGPLVAPFRGVFDDQQYWATALTAAVVYTVGYLIATAVLRRDRTD